ncbi:carboxymuconolactone decarboxylase family protein [Micromonospora sp. NPDC048935]|uniref:carboxymuconolactone decarboxylase family protein n=1 Tax=Micromonospora sp. NPDC048935 TaxID=3364262 RepID=UPI00371A2530
MALLLLRTMAGTIGTALARRVWAAHGHRRRYRSPMMARSGGHLDLPYCLVGNAFRTRLQSLSGRAAVSIDIMFVSEPTNEVIMHAGLLRPILGVLGLTQVRHVTPVRRGAATGLVGRVYRQVEHDFGVLAPPIALHAGAPPALAAAWVMLREIMLVPGTLSRAQKEAIAAEVSRQNRCPYCVTVHETVVRRLGPPATGPAPAGADPEAVAMSLVMNYLNRMVNVFLREVPLPPHVPTRALRPVMRVLGTDMLAAATRRHPVGASLDLLPDADLPDDLAWSAAAPTAAPALARAAAAIEAGGRRALPDPARETVLRALSGWHGEPMGISRRWTDDLVTDLPATARPTARLALLVALASFQVDTALIVECRAAGADDQTLLELSSWSAMIAARRKASLITIGSRQ